MKNIFIILIATFFGVSQSFACDCYLRPNTKEDFEWEWNNVEYIFELEIISVLHEPKEDFFGIRILEAKVIKKYKGHTDSKTIEIYTEMDGGANCNYYFIVGQSYLFYGYKKENSNYFDSTICNRTGELKEKEFDLKLLKERENGDQ